MELYATMKEGGRAPQRYLLLEVSPDLRERQRALVAERFPQELDRFVWIDRLPEKIRGFVVANEVLDVVPFSLVHRRRGELLERGVILSDAGFAWDDQPMPDGDLKRRAAAVFPPGDYDYLSEIGLAAEALVRTLAASLEAGVALFIDYGFPEREFYHPQRSMGTLRCHYRHRFHGDPFFMPGLQDITAHVDFTSIRTAAEEEGLQTLGFLDQTYFLLGLFSDATSPDTARLRALKTLIMPGGLGSTMKVLIFGKGVGTPALRGCSFRMRVT